MSEILKKSHPKSKIVVITEAVFLLDCNSKETADGEETIVLQCQAISESLIIIEYIYKEDI